MLFGNFPFGYLLYGGAEVQLERTRAALLRLGANVELFSPWDRTILDGVDIIHWFHIDPSSTEILRIAKQRGLRIVVSTIFWPANPWLAAQWTRVSRWPRRFGLPLTSRLAMAYDVLRLADAVIVSSHSEGMHVKRIFGVPSKNIRVVPVGVAKEFQYADSELFVNRYGLRDFVLCVGRVEPRKNQLRLLQALRDVDMPVVIIGDCSVNPEYYRRCVDVGHPRVYFLGSFPHNDPMLRSAYAAARVLVMPSLLESPGLVALEAALAGCPVAATSVGNTREYFQDYVEYLDPKSTTSIRRAVMAAASLPDVKVEAFKNLIIREYSWECVGHKLLRIYEELLASKSDTCS